MNIPFIINILGKLEPPPPPSPNRNVLCMYVCIINQIEKAIVFVVWQQSIIVRFCNLYYDSFYFELWKSFCNGNPLLYMVLILPLKIYTDVTRKQDFRSCNNFFNKMCPEFRAVVWILLKLNTWSQYPMWALINLRINTWSQYPMWALINLRINTLIPQF